MSVPSVGGASAVGQLFQAYSRQLLSGPAATGTASAAAPATAADPAAAARGADFASNVGQGLASLERLDANAQGLAVKAATGDLNDVHDYVVAASEAQIAAELTTTVRNKAVEAFNEIMRMPL